MIYFMAPTEGGEFIRIERKNPVPAMELISSFIEQELEAVFVFDGGLVYDGFLGKMRGTAEENQGIYDLLIEYKNLKTEYIE